ncbi:hypothetical protein NWE60_06450 [Mycoplasmopsis felis]|nr:hypothetical protein [Mycoplasmopsis felis]WAM01003.1 hypothetical protein NWE60_06450 [Mycoplasmopsis felis]
MNESKYSEVKKELEAAKMHAEVAKSEENTTKEKLSQEKQTLDDAIEKAKRDKENLRETPSNVTTETKSFEETQYVYAFKDTPVKEALKSQIDQGWIFENLEEVSQQDNAKNTDNSNTYHRYRVCTRTKQCRYCKFSRKKSIKRRNTDSKSKYSKPD